MRTRSSTLTFFVMVGVAVLAGVGFMLYRGSLEAQRDRAMDVGAPGVGQKR